jgi:hypothetical protein
VTVSPLVLGIADIPGCAGNVAEAPRADID